MIVAMSRRPVRARDDADPAVRAVSHLVRTTRWAGLRPGDAVDVAGMRLRSATWAFVAHVRNARTGEEWVEVVGGRPGCRSLRSVRPEQVLPPPARGTRAAARAPLAAAPRLPL
jgi:hypothetical protein